MKLQIQLSPASWLTAPGWYVSVRTASSFLSEPSPCHPSSSDFLMPPLLLLHSGNGAPWSYATQIPSLAPSPGRKPNSFEGPADDSSLPALVLHGSHPTQPHSCPASWCHLPVPCPSPSMPHRPITMGRYSASPVTLMITSAPSPSPTSPASASPFPLA